jgi:dipeptidyl aminopeptidase/acylaminoacyl peptidase
MNKAFLILLISIFCFSAFSQHKINFILKKQEIDSTIPFFKEIVTYEDRHVLKRQYKYVDSLNFYNLKYKTPDSLNIGGFLIEPKKRGVYPVIIYNRGGNANFGTVKYHFLIQYLGLIASKGYIVIGSQLRGSEVSEGQDEFGGKDVNDALDIIKIIDELPNTDKNKIALFGWSRGVMTNFLMLKNTTRIKTCISIAGQADLALTHRLEMFNVYKERIPNYEKDKDNLLKQRSSLLNIDSIQNKQVSHFIIHGNSDTRVEVKSAFLLYNKLMEKNYKTKLLIYPNEEHSLNGVFNNLIYNICDWLGTELK